MRAAPALEGDAYLLFGIIGLGGNVSLAPPLDPPLQATAMVPRTFDKGIFGGKRTFKEPM